MTPRARAVASWATVRLAESADTRWVGDAARIGPVVLAQSESWMIERAVQPVEANSRARRTASAVRWAALSAGSFLTSMRTVAAAYGRTAASTAVRRATG